MSNRCGCMKLNPIAFGFSVGVASGVFMMALAWVAWVWSFGAFIVQQIAAVCPGYAATLNGGLYGLGWGILIGYIFGLLLAIVYNICTCCSPCRCCCCKSVE